MYNDIYDNFFRMIKRDIIAITSPGNSRPKDIRLFLYFISMILSLVLMLTEFPVIGLALFCVFAYRLFMRLRRVNGYNIESRQKFYMDNHISKIIDILQHSEWNLYNIDGLNMIIDICSARITEMEQKIATYTNVLILSSVLCGFKMITDKADSASIGFVVAVVIMITIFSCILGWILIFLTNLSSPLTLTEYQKFREDIKYIMYHMQKEQAEKTRRQKFEKLITSDLT